MSLTLPEDEQSLRLAQWWKRYGRLSLRFLLVLLVVVFGLRWYQQHQVMRVEHASAAFESLMQQVSEQHTKAVIEQATWLKQHYPTTVYASGAAMVLAQQQIQAKQWQAALEQLMWIRQHSKADSVRYLATIYQARLDLFQGHYQQVIDLLTNIPPKGGFVVEKQQLLAEAFTQLGQKQQAKEAYQRALAELPADTTLYAALLRDRYSRDFPNALV